MARPNQYTQLSQRYSPQEPEPKDDFVTWLGKTLIGSALGLGANLGNAAIESGAQPGGWLDMEITPEETLQARRDKAALEGRKTEAGIGLTNAQAQKAKDWKGVEDYRTAASMYGNTVDANARLFDAQQRYGLGLLTLQQKWEEAKKKGQGGGARKPDVKPLPDSSLVGRVGPDGSFYTEQDITNFRALVGPQRKQAIAALLGNDAVTNVDELMNDQVAYERLLDSWGTPAIIDLNNPGVPVPLGSRRSGEPGQAVPQPGAVPQAGVSKTDAAKMAADAEQAEAQRQQQAEIARAQATAGILGRGFSGLSGAITRGIDTFSNPSSASDAVKAVASALPGYLGGVNEAFANVGGPVRQAAPDAQAMAQQKEADRARVQRIATADPSKRAAAVAKFKAKYGEEP